LLGGMLGLPTSPWSGESCVPEFPSEANWCELGEVRHVFTHFALTLKVWRAETDETLSTTRAQASDGLPSVFAKALKLAL
jgi:A/G-specific adenine glycosylase